jgi:hypothetical protein
VSAPAAPTQAPPAQAEPGIETAAEACPLCGAPLAAEQEWCLRCGAAARTRLAAAPSWKGPLVAVAVVAVLALAVLAAALVKLAGDTGPAPAPLTRTVTSPAAATTPTAVPPGAATSAPATTAPATTTPATTAPGATSGPVQPKTGASGAQTRTSPASPATGGGGGNGTKSGNGGRQGAAIK